MFVGEKRPPKNLPAEDGDEAANSTRHISARLPEDLHGRRVVKTLAVVMIVLGIWLLFASLAVLANPESVLWIAP